MSAHAPRNLDPIQAVPQASSTRSECHVARALRRGISDPTGGLYTAAHQSRWAATHRASSVKFKGDAILSCLGRVFASARTVQSCGRNKTELRRLAQIQLIANPFFHEYCRQAAVVADGEIEGQAQADERVFRLIDVDEQVLQRHGTHRWQSIRTAFPGGPCLTPVSSAAQPPSSRCRVWPIVRGFRYWDRTVRRCARHRPSPASLAGC
jgi:hypothetical protein